MSKELVFRGLSYSDMEEIDERINHWIRNKEDAVARSGKDANKTPIARLTLTLRNETKKAVDLMCVWGFDSDAYMIPSNEVHTLHVTVMKDEVWMHGKTIAHDKSEGSWSLVEMCSHAFLVERVHVVYDVASVAKKRKITIPSKDDVIFKKGMESFILGLDEDEPALKKSKAAAAAESSSDDDDE